MKKCYYEILEVDKKASVADIKTVRISMTQSYRKMAIKYHPDKNLGDQQAKKMFIAVQEAYEVLSDPNERTWYDTNREKILYPKQEMTKEDIEMHTFGFNIWTYFANSCFKGYDDEEGGFYQVYRQVFERIKTEQKKAFDNSAQEGDFRKLEGFGNSTTGIDRVLKFYQDWTNFNTCKTFVWIEQYDTREAPNRYVRREMEKQNKKQRQKEKKHYLKTIADLIQYLKKRDPRYKAHLDELKKIEAKREEQRKLQQEQLKIQKEEQRILKKQMDEQRMKEIEEYYKQKEGEKGESSAEQEEEIEEFHCQLCNKGFKTANQLENHKNSKLHKQNLKAIFKEVALDEDRQLIMESLKEDEKPEKPSKKKKKKKGDNKQEENGEEAEKTELPKQEQATKEPEEQAKAPVSAPTEEKKKKKKKRNDDLIVEVQEEQKVVEKPKEEKTVQKEEKKEESSEEDDFVASMMRNKTKKQNVIPPVVVKTTQKPTSEPESDEEQEAKGPGKAKLKRMKKAEKQAENQDTKMKCTTCGLGFPSKTKLFDHIKQMGHAQTKK